MKNLKHPPLTRNPETALQAVEIPYETGGLHFRYTQRISADGSEWLRDGLFEEYYQNGSPAVRGFYRNGAESGRWKEYHENGRLAAEGYYAEGQKTGTWQYYDEQGRLKKEEKIFPY